jgi:hypothetical protein
MKTKLEEMIETVLKLENLFLFGEPLKVLNREQRERLLSLIYEIKANNNVKIAMESGNKEGFNPNDPIYQIRKEVEYLKQELNNFFAKFSKQPEPTILQTSITKWEYKEVISFDESNKIHFINGLGSEGWELITISVYEKLPNSDIFKLVYTFKRQLP